MLRRRKKESDGPLLILGATGALGRHVLRLALAAGHDVTVLVRTPSKLPPEAPERVSVHTGDLGAYVPLDLVKGQDTLVNCAGHVADGDTFVALIERLVTAVESLPVPEQPVCWFLAGAALLDIDPSGRRGVDLPKVKSTYWPHRVNFERLRPVAPGLAPVVSRADGRCARVGTGPAAHLAGRPARAGCRHSPACSPARRWCPSSGR